MGRMGINGTPILPMAPPPIVCHSKISQHVSDSSVSDKLLFDLGPAASAACTTLFGLLILPLLVVVSETVFTLVLLLVVLLLTYHTTINSLHVTNGID